MAAQTNTTVSTDFARPQSIDFVNQFNGGIAKLLEVLGVTRIHRMPIGSTIKFYKATKDLKSGTVAEGDLIPLSKMSTQLDGTKELVYNKYRKRVTGEAIQRNGFAQAVSDTDLLLEKEIQKRIRADWFTNLEKGTGTKTAKNPGLQGALAAAWGAVQASFEDDGVQTIAFVNPVDVEDYIGQANITTQTAFGMTFITGFTNVLVVTNTNVPAGKIRATAPQNINLAYADVNGELNKAFGFTTDQLGYVGITHDRATDSFAYDTVCVDAMVLYAERLDGVFKIDIVAPTVEGA